VLIGRLGESLMALNWAAPPARRSASAFEMGVIVGGAYGFFRCFFAAIADLTFV
jgi:hypothetical protein